MNLRCLFGHSWTQWKRRSDFWNVEYSEYRWCVHCNRMEYR